MHLLHGPQVQNWSLRSGGKYSFWQNYVGLFPFVKDKMSCDDIQQTPTCFSRQELSGGNIVASFPPQLCFCEECCYCQLLVALEAHIYGELVHFKFTFRNRVPNSPISSSLFSLAQQSCHPTIKDLNHGNHNSSEMSCHGELERYRPRSYCSTAVPPHHRQIT